MTPIYVIIPVYNAEKYLTQAVDSVLHQPCADIRIILVNDGSSDGSPALCDKLVQVHPSIRVIHQENRGVSSARNAGIACALQEGVHNAYLAFLDADDLWHPDFLDQNVLAGIEQAQHDIYAFGMITSDEKAEHFSVPQPYKQQSITGGYAAIWSLQDTFAANLYHISLFRQWDVRFFTEYKYSEDKYFKVLCSFFAKTIVFSPKTMYIYREAIGSAMSKATKIKATDYFLPIIDGWLQTEAIINQHFSTHGVTTELGHVLGNVYLLDMVCTHYMQQGSISEIKGILQQHPNYPYLVTMKPMGENDVNYKRKELYFQHPMLFAVKYRLLGIVQRLMRWALRIPVVQRQNDKRKHPLNYLP